LRQEFLLVGDLSPLNALIGNGPPRLRGELACPHHDHRGGRGHHENKRADEPAEIGEREEEGALAAIEVTSGIGEQAGRTLHVGGGLGRILGRGEGSRAEQDRDVVEQAVRPGEFEERIDPDHGEADDLCRIHTAR